MDARTALKMYTATMIKTYGPNYWENWTEDDRETFDVLAMRARKWLAPKIQTKRTTFMTRFLGGRTPGVIAPEERTAAWKAHADKHGSGIRGKLSAIKNPYQGNGDSHSVKEYDKPAPEGSLSARISEREWESAEQTGSVASMLMARFSH